MLEKLILLFRNIFYKCFLIGFLFYIFTAGFFLLNNGWSVSFIANIYHISKPEVNLLIAFFIGSTKTIIVLFFLLPALALHWTRHSLKKTKK